MSIFSFKKNNEKSVNNSTHIKLSDYKKIYSKFCFLDETGTLEDDQNPFFTIGILSCSQPFYLNKVISRERDVRKVYDEIKFNKLSSKNIEFAKFMIDTYFEAKSVSFHSYTLDKGGEYFFSSFNGNVWDAYKETTMRVMEAIDKPNQVMTLIADNVTTPKEVKFEVDVKYQLNHNLKRFAVTGVCRVDSKSNDLLQLTDLIIGAISYDLKLKYGVVKKGSKHKRRFVEYLKEQLGVKDDFSDGFRNFNTSFFVDKSVKNRGDKADFIKEEN